MDKDYILDELILKKNGSSGLSGVTSSNRDRNVSTIVVSQKTDPELSDFATPLKSEEPDF